MYIVVFYLLFCFVNQRMFCEARCKPFLDNHDTNLIYLLETNVMHREINMKFINFYYNSHDNDMLMTIHTLNNCSANLNETMEDVKGLRYVIHLYVGDFYQNNYKTIMKNNFTWSGDISMARYRKVCRSDGNNRRDDKETCTDYSEQQKYVKLVSDQIMWPKLYPTPEYYKVKLLQKTVQNFNVQQDSEGHVNVIERKKYIIENIIVICGSVPHSQPKNSDIILKYSDKYKIIKISYSDDCRRTKDVVAILAPNPEAIEETSIPVIFYEEPYAHYDVKAFNNSIIKFRSVNTLGKAFLQFINEMKWDRVAILSDDSDDSEAFEKELRSLFNCEGISHISVISLSDKYYCCNFSDALESLKQAEATIVIANVDEKNADKLATQIKRHKMTYNKVVWIARDWLPDTASRAVKKIYSIISIRSKRTPLTTYVEAVDSTIRNLYHENQYNDEYKLDLTNQKHFVEFLRGELKYEETDIDVVIASRRREELTVMKFKGGRVTVQSHPADLFDRNSECTLKSANFYKNCDDLNILLIMLVITVFAMTVLGITYFFSAPNIAYNRMN